MIEFKNVEKSFRKEKVIRGVDLSLEAGKVYGILGKDFSGKSTLLKLASGQSKPSEGEVLFDGTKIYEKSNITENICFVREEGIGIDDLKVNKMLRMASIAYKNWDEKFKDVLVEEFEIDLNQRYYKLSREEQMLVGVITGLASRADWTIFDEPSTYLSTVNLQKFCEILRIDLESNPRSIIITSREVDLTDSLMDEVIVMRSGKVVINGDLDTIKSRLFYISGDKDSVRDVEIYKNLIFKESFGDTIVLGVYDDITSSLRDSYRGRGLVTSEMPFERAYFYFTNDLISISKKEYPPIEFNVFGKKLEEEDSESDKNKLDEELIDIEKFTEDDGEMDRTDRISKTEVIQKIITEDGEQKKVEEVIIDSIEEDKEDE